jgi:adenine C2-methylase RlmN of 23S rRNA A2503 and tRNA A37
MYMFIYIYIYYFNTYISSYSTLALLLSLSLSMIHAYISKTVAGMIEYILIAGVNDSSDCAHKMGELLKTRNVMLNLIP